MPVKPESNRCYPDGSTFDKVFDNKTFTGTVIGLDAKKGFYSICYNDGDKEELEKMSSISSSLPPIQPT